MCHVNKVYNSIKYEIGCTYLLASASTENIEIHTNDTVDELEIVIKDPAALELETEMNMCTLLGINFSEYKEFQDNVWQGCTIY